MTFLREFVAWLADYYAASTALLLLLGITRACLRQPIQRMVLAWATLISLTALLVLSAIPTWPRISLPPKVETRSDRPRISETSRNVVAAPFRSWPTLPASVPTSAPLFP